MKLSSKRKFKNSYARVGVYGWCGAGVYKCFSTFFLLCFFCLRFFIRAKLTQTHIHTDVRVLSNKKYSMAGPENAVDQIVFIDS